MHIMQTSMGHLLSYPHPSSRSSLCTLPCEAPPLPSPLCSLCAVRAPERNGGCSQGLALLFIRFQWYLVPIFASLAPSETSQAQSRVFPDPWKIVSQNWLPFPPPQTTRSERPSFHPTTFCSLLLQSSRRPLLFTLILLFWSV